MGREERDARDATKCALESQRVSRCSLSLRLDATLLVSLRDVGEARSEQEDASSKELGSGDSGEGRREEARAERERLDLGRRDKAKEG